jgi:hypothetical protein
VHADEQLRERRPVRARIARVAERLADRRHADARRQRRVDQQGAPELGARRTAAGDGEQLLRDVDPEHVVAGRGERLRGDAAPAPEVDHAAAVEARAGQAIDEEGGRHPREVAEGGVVHVGEIAAVEGPGIARHHGQRGDMCVALVRSLRRR